MTDPIQKIERMQQAEGEVRAAQDELISLAEHSRAQVISALREAIIEGLGEGEGVDAAIALVPIAEVLGELEGQDVCELLIELLGSDEVEVRVAAGSAFQELAYDRFKEAALAAERAAERLQPDHHALCELPYLLAEIAEPGVVRVLRPFLAHSNAEVVAATIEALASLGDPSAAGDLRKLIRDVRTVQVESDDDDAQASIGLLAQEAIELLVPVEIPVAPARGGAKTRPGSGSSQRGGNRRS